MQCARRGAGQKNGSCNAVAFGVGGLGNGERRSVRPCAGSRNAMLLTMRYASGWPNGARFQTGATASRMVMREISIRTTKTCWAAIAPQDGLPKAHLAVV